MVDTVSNAFRAAFKSIRSLSPDDALRQASEPNGVDGHRFCPRPLQPVDSVHLDRLHLKLDGWQAFELSDIPGFWLIRNAFTDRGLYNWARLCLVDWTRWPKRCNVPDDHVGLADPLIQKSKVRWITYGYHHDWDSKVYSDAVAATEMPPEMVMLAKTLAARIGYADYKPEASIVNYYSIRSSMSGHVDRSERNLNAPLISVSLGQPCVFLIGGQTVRQEPTALALRHGDVSIMSGLSRLAYHGVPRIVKADHFESSSVDADIAQYLNEHRINFNIRQVN